MRFRFTGLWLHSEFRKLWAGQASSLFASQVMYIGLPLLAVIVLEATPLQMGIVVALTGLPALLGLYMGSWVDRRRKRPVLVIADLARAVLMAIVPVAHLLDVLTIEVVYVVAFGLAAMTMLFQIGYRSLLPLLVERSQLTEANSKLELATSGAGVGGPAGVGVLVEWITAPFTFVAGAILYFVSALFFLDIKTKEPEPERNGADGGGIGEGLRYFWQHKPLVGIVASSFLFAVFGTAIEAMAVLYMINELGLSPGVLGVMITIGGTGLFLGSVVSSKYASRIGIGRATTFGLVLVAVGEFSIPLATGPLPAVIVTLVAGAIVTQVGIVLYNVGGVSIRQATAPDELQARLTSISVVLSRVGVPVGGLLGGVLGELIGLRETLLVAATGMLMASSCLVVFKTWPVRLQEAEAGAA